MHDSTKKSPQYQGKYIVILIHSLFTFCLCRLAIVWPLWPSFLLLRLFMCHVTVDTAQLGQVRVKAFLRHLRSVHPTLTTRDLPFILLSPPNSVLPFYSNTWLPVCTSLQWQWRETSKHLPDFLRTSFLHPPCTIVPSQNRRTSTFQICTLAESLDSIDTHNLRSRRVARL
jgi:hypothetical protein